MFEKETVLFYIADFIGVAAVLPKPCGQLEIDEQRASGWEADMRCYSVNIIRIKESIRIAFLESEKRSCLSSNSGGQTVEIIQLLRIGDLSYVSKNQAYIADSQIGRISKLEISDEFVV